MAAARVPFYYCMTSGIRITARPSFLQSQSNPAARHFVFTYRIRIENAGDVAARLLTRRWLIHDEGAVDTVVEGDGVVGEQPHLAPGEAHEYSSFCVLSGPRGWMEGSYHFVRDDGTSFDAVIPRFLLSAEPSADSLA